MEEQHEHEIGGHQQEENAERLRQTTPAIWVASLADYNAGRLVGAWIDATGEVADVEAAVQQMLANSPMPGAEEWAIFVTNGFGPLDINEYEQLEVVNRIAKGIEAHGVAFAHYVELVGTDELDDLDRFEECFLGRYDTFEEYVENLIDDRGYREAIDAAVPPGLEGYVDIDVEGLARDMSMSGIYATAADADGVYVFDMGR